MRSQVVIVLALLAMSAHAQEPLMQFPGDRARYAENAQYRKCMADRIPEASRRDFCESEWVPLRCRVEGREAYLDEIDDTLTPDELAKREDVLREDYVAANMKYWDCQRAGGRQRVIR